MTGDCTQRRVCGCSRKDYNVYELIFFLIIGLPPHTLQQKRFHPASPYQELGNIVQLCPTYPFAGKLSKLLSSYKEYDA